MVLNIIYIYLIIVISTMNELRKDYLLNRWTIIAKERGQRPHDFIGKIKSKERKDAVCYFCSGNEHMTPPEIDRIEEDGKWIVRCFPNKFPATTEQKSPLKTNLLTEMSAYGKHEVIAETPNHGVELGDLSTEHIDKVLEMYTRRLVELKKDKSIRYVSIFKNRGDVAGASLEHPHTQIIGVSIIPPIIEREIEEIKKYRKEKNSCILCDVWSNEMESERRIHEDEYTAVFASYASMFPFEVRIMPKRHVHTLEQLTGEERKSFAEAMKKILSALNKTLDYPPYNSYFHLSPDKEDFHLYMEILPRLSRWAGFELSNDIIINTMPPEMAAKHYRNNI